MNEIGVLCVLGVVMLFVGAVWATRWLNAPENHPAVRSREMGREGRVGIVGSSLVECVARFGLPVIVLALVIIVCALSAAVI